MSQESEQAQEAWIARADAVSSMHAGDYLVGQSELKAALKAEIEKRRETLHLIVNLPDYDYRDRQDANKRLDEVMKFLSLLDTVTPIK